MDFTFAKKAFLFKSLFGFIFFTENAICCQSKIIKNPIFAKDF
jgi:hypothetical protein